MRCFHDINHVVIKSNQIALGKCKLINEIKKKSNQKWNHIDKYHQVGHWMWWHFHRNSENHEEIAILWWWKMRLSGELSVLQNKIMKGELNRIYRVLPHMNLILLFRNKMILIWYISQFWIQLNYSWRSLKFWDMPTIITFSERFDKTRPNTR